AVFLGEVVVGGLVGEVAEGELEQRARRGPPLIVFAEDVMDLDVGVAGGRHDLQRRVALNFDVELHLVFGLRGRDADDREGGHDANQALHSVAPSVVQVSVPVRLSSLPGSLRPLPFAPPTAAPRTADFPRCTKHRPTGSLGATRAPMVKRWALPPRGLAACVTRLLPPPASEKWRPPQRA